MKLKKLYSTVLATTLAFTVVSCGSTEEPAEPVNDTTGNTDEVVQEEVVDEVSDETLSVGLMSSISALPMVIAEEKGFFEEEGLNIDVQTFKAAKDRDAALQAGELDGVIADEVAIAIYNNADMDIVITGNSLGAFTLVSGPNSGITSFEDLKGKSVGISENTAIDYDLDKMLELNGLELTDVERVAIPPMPTRLEMLKSGEIDAAVMPNPFSDDAIAAGGTELAVADGTTLPFISTTAFFRTVTEERAGDVKAYYRALNKAADYINSADKSELEDIAIAQLGYPETMRGNIIIPVFTHNQLPKDEEINDVFDWCRQRGILTKDITAEDVTSTVGIIE